MHIHAGAGRGRWQFWGNEPTLHKRNTAGASYFASVSRSTSTAIRKMFLSSCTRLRLVLLTTRNSNIFHKIRPFSLLDTCQQSSRVSTLGHSYRDRRYASRATPLNPNISKPAVFQEFGLSLYSPSCCEFAIPYRRDLQALRADPRYPAHLSPKPAGFGFPYLTLGNPNFTSGALHPDPNYRPPG